MSTSGYDTTALSNYTQAMPRKVKDSIALRCFSAWVRMSQRSIA